MGKPLKRGKYYPPINSESYTIIGESTEKKTLEKKITIELTLKR
jgi:hypothetical protein